MRIAISLALIAAAWIGLALGVDPVPTWFYVFAWYPTLVVLDELAHRIDGRPRLLRGWARIASLLGWSAVIWLVFEAANFRLANWYYVFLPRHPVERWAGILLSFATVVPALVLMARVLDALTKGRVLRTRPLPFPASQRWISSALGVALSGLALIWPRTFFPTIWGAVWLLLEPFVYRRRPELSLFADLSRGEWGRVARLLLAGLLVGGLWEFYNFWARGKWIYTVPWLEDLKLFEMPPVGFLGFPFFALEAWAMYAALVAVGAAVPVEMRAVTGGYRRLQAVEVQQHTTARNRPKPPVTAFATALIAALFAAATLLGMERWTISSVVPSLADLPGVNPYVEELRAAGIDSPFELAAMSADELATTTRIPRDLTEALVETAGLATLRGLGGEHAKRLRELGVLDRCTLAHHDPPTLWSLYHGRPVMSDPTTVTPPTRPAPAEVRVWVRAAGRTCARER